MSKTSSGRLHRRRHAHADRQVAPRLLPQHAARRPAGRRDAARRWRRCRRWTRRRSRTPSSAARCPKAQQGLNVARIGALLAGLPNSVGGITVNRFCASGLSAVQMAADRIRVGEADVMIAGGVESMSMVPMMGNTPSLSPAHLRARRERRHRLRHGPDGREGGAAVEGRARGAGRVRAAVAPEGAGGAAGRRVRRRDHADRGRPTARPTSRPARSIAKTRTVSLDEGAARRTPRSKALAKLRPVFAARASVTAGNSSQTSRRRRRADPGQREGRASSTT